MANYIISNDFKTLEEIWDDLLRLHWDYLDTEENMEKLKMRRKLEGIHNEPCYYSAELKKSLYYFR